MLENSPSAGPPRGVPEEGPGLRAGGWTTVGVNGIRYGEYPSMTNKWILNKTPLSLLLTESLQNPELPCHTFLSFNPEWGHFKFDLYCASLCTHFPTKQRGDIGDRWNHTIQKTLKCVAFLYTTEAIPRIFIIWLVHTKPALAPSWAYLCLFWSQKTGLITE